MPIIIIVVLLLVIGIGVFIKVKINNTVYRGKQQMLNKVGIGNASVNQSMDQGLEKIALNRLLQQNPNMTEQYVKDTLYNYSMQIISRQNNPMFSDKVITSMQHDKRLDLMIGMQFVRVNVLSYMNNFLYAVVIYTDGRDEYQISINAIINSNGLFVDNYSSKRGDVVGL